MMAVANHYPIPKITGDYQQLCDDLLFLKPEHLPQLDRALRAVGDYGEVRLQVVKGRLRFIVTSTSESVDSA